MASDVDRLDWLSEQFSPVKLEDRALYFAKLGLAWPSSAPVKTLRDAIDFMMARGETGRSARSTIAPDEAPDWEGAGFFPNPMPDAHIGMSRSSVIGSSRKTALGSGVKRIKGG